MGQGGPSSAFQTTKKKKQNFLNVGGNVRPQTTPTVPCHPPVSFQLKAGSASSKSRMEPPHRPVVREVKIGAFQSATSYAGTPINRSTPAWLPPRTGAGLWGHQSPQRLTTTATRFYAGPPLPLVPELHRYYVQLPPTVPRVDCMNTATITPLPRPALPLRGSTWPSSDGSVKFIADAIHLDVWQKLAPEPWVGDDASAS